MAGELGYPGLVNAEANPSIVVLLDPQPDPEVFDDTVRIDFVIDPSINRYRKVYYRARCVASAKVSTHTSAGATTVYMYQWNPYDRHGSRYASAAWKSQSGEIRRSRSSALVSFDVKVKGWINGSQYDIFGWWVEGGGGFC